MAKHNIVVLAIAFTVLASVLGAYHLGAATIITGTDPSGDVSVISYGSPPPNDVIGMADIVSVTLTFTDSSLTAEFEVANDLPSGLVTGDYGIYFLGTIVGSSNGRYAKLSLGLGNILGYQMYGNAFAVIEDSDGNLIAFYYGNSVSFSVQGNKVVMTAPVGTSTFMPSLGNVTDYSSIVAGVSTSGGTTSVAVDDINLYESGSISTGEATQTTTPPTQTTTTTTTTTYEQPYEDDPLKQTPTTGDVTVALSPPESSRITVDPTTNIVEVDIRGTGSTSGAPPDHVGVGVITYYKDGNFTYDIFNGEGNWDADNDPSNGYTYSMSFMGYTITLEVTPTGPSDNPWATFSYHFYGKAPANAIAVFASLQDIDRAYVYARAYLDRDEAQWNQAHTDLPINAGVGEVTTATTPGGVGTTTTAGSGSTSTEETTTAAGGSAESPAARGIDPMIIAGAVAAVAVIAVVVFMLRRK